jgi:hypothetical protein
MGATAQLEIRRARRSAGGVWLDMMELEETALVTASLIADERTPALVALPDFTPDTRRHVSRLHHFRR